MTGTDAPGPADRSPVTIADARVVAPESTFRGYVRLAAGEIVACEPGAHPPDADRVVDADGRVAIPGLVDLHGDDVEDHLAPRADRPIDPALGLATCDRANVAAGVTTKLHAIAVEDEPAKRRSIEGAGALVDRIRNASGHLVDHRIHARCELTVPASVDAGVALLDRGATDLLTVQSALPGMGQFDDREAFRDWYAANDGNARRTVDVDDAADRLFDPADGSTPALRRRLDRLRSAADAADVPLGAHDPESATEVAGLADAGAAFVEYPVTRRAAREAVRRGLSVVAGAPNFVHGGSLFGNLDARAALEANCLDCLCADYHPASLLAAAFADTGEPRHERVERVTAAPAVLAGLADRGRLARGARADVVLVEPDPAPTVSRAFVAGREVYRAGDQSVPSGSQPP